MPKNILKITPASYLVLIKNGKLLMLRRFNTGFMDGNYSLVAGRMENNEGFTKAVIREAKEEANLILQAENLKVIHIMDRYEPRNNAGSRERVDVFFTTKKWHGKIKIMESNKCDDLNWFPINKLPLNTIPYIRQAIGHIRKKIFYSEFGYIK